MYNSLIKKIAVSVIIVTVLIGGSACGNLKEDETEGIKKVDFTEYYRDWETNEIKIPNIVIDEIIFENIDKSIFQKELPIYKSLKCDIKDGHAEELLDKFSFDSNYRIYPREGYDLYRDAKSNELEYMGKGFFNFRPNGYDYNNSDLTANMSDDEAKAMAAEYASEFKLSGDYIVMDFCGSLGAQDGQLLQKIVTYSRKLNDYRVMNIGSGRYPGMSSLSFWLSDSGINMIRSSERDYEENGVYTTISKEKAIEKMLNFSKHKDVYIGELGESINFSVKNQVKINSAELAYFDDIDPSIEGFDVLPGYFFEGEISDEIGNSTFFYALVGAIELE